MNSISVDGVWKASTSEQALFQGCHGGRGKMNRSHNVNVGRKEENKRGVGASKISGARMLSTLQCLRVTTHLHFLEVSMLL